MLQTLREICQDEKRDLSSTRTIAFALSIISVVLIMLSVVFLPFSKEFSSWCFEIVKFLLGSTGPVVLLVGAGQAKTALTNVSNNVTQIKVDNTLNTGMGKRERKKNKDSQSMENPKEKRIQ